ncbi:LPXTG cell wall anchor domain-containing protein [Kitasatospora sp. NPDC004745]|uniref:COG1470 family protein n=1 Tax=Kitasatospora sp. NPDC004745 TaxID=3364019 RepID=UPI0036834E09
MRARRSGSTVLTAATLGVLLATGAVVASPAAYAADAPAAVTAPAEPAATPAAEPTAAASAAATEKPAEKPADKPAAKTAEAGKPALTVNAPASIGHGGEPVEFTETVTNPGDAAASYTLRVDASSPAAPAKGITVDYRDADGTWKPLGSGGEVPGLTVAAGATRTVRLRLATPLHNAWGNQDAPVTLRSAVLDQAKAVLAESTAEVVAKALTLQVKGAPTSAVAGGAPVEFDVTVTNPSASGYTGVSKVVEATRNSTFQVQEADGGWETVTGTPQDNGRVLYHLTEDRTLAAGASFTKHVRIAFTADAAPGTEYIHPWAMLGEGGAFMPLVIGPQFVAVDVTAAPVAAKPSLTVQEPASIGNGGRPVEFTETVTNPGGTDASFTLKLKASNQWARSKDRITLEYRDADGTWKPVTLNFALGDKTVDFSGEIPGVTVAAGVSRTLQLRLAAPLNNDWASQSSTVKLYSAIADSANTVVAESTKDVALKALTVQVKNAPTSAVIGGAPVEFDVTATNPSASAYDDASLVVQADQQSTLQVQKADGGWQDVTGTPSRQSTGPLTYHLTDGKDLAAGASVTKHVRLAFTAGAAIGASYVHGVVILGEGGQYMPASIGPQGFRVDLSTAPGTGSAVKAGFTAASADDAATTGTGATTGTTAGTARLAGGELAHTGSDGVLTTAAGAAALLVSGLGALFAARRRRSA